VSRCFTLKSVFSIADRYITKEYLKFFFASLTIFSTLYLVVDMLSNIWQLKADSATLWTYYLFKIPNIVYLMTPASCLMATIFTISILSRSNELIALFSSGISLARVALPILMVTSIIAVCSFFVSDRLVPPATRKQNYIMYIDILKRPNEYYTVKTNKIWYRSKDLIYNIKTFNPQKGLMQGLTIYYFDPNWHLVQLITAEEARFEGVNWRLSKGTVTLFAEENSFPLTQPFQEKVITLDERPGEFQEIDIDNNIMTVRELRRYIRKNKEAGLDTIRYEVAYHGKFSFAFVSFVMAFLGIPFSVSKDRSGSFALGVGVCLFFVFVYWTMVSIGMSLGSHGTLPPVLAAWLPNALMLGVSVFFLLRLKK